MTGPSGGPPVILLHALGESRQDWPEVTGRLAEQYTVVAVDLRGHGDSDRTSAYSTRAMVDDVARLLDHLDLPAPWWSGTRWAAWSLIDWPRSGRTSSDGSGWRTFTTLRPDRPVPDRPEGELPFDWVAVLALRSEAERADDALWAQLRSIAAPTLLIGGGPDSPVPPDRRRADPRLRAGRDRGRASRPPEPDR